MSRPVAKVAVIGRDAAAWISALGLQRALLTPTDLNRTDVVL